MLRYLRLALAFVGLVLIVVLAVDNRQIIDIIFWPLPFSVPLPVYGLFLIGLFAGAILGGLSVWLASLSSRMEARRMKRQVRSFEYREEERRAREEQAQVDEAKRKTQALAITAPSSG